MEEREATDLAPTTADRVTDADLVAVSLDALLVTDRSGRIESANPAAAAMLPAVGNRLVGKPLVSFVAAEHRRTFRDCLARAGTGERVRFAAELLIEGQLVPVLVRVLPRGPALAWVIHDESDLVRAGEAAVAAIGDPRLESVQLDLVLERVRDGVVVIDRELRVRYANRTAHALLAPQPPVPGEPIPESWSTTIRDLITDLLQRDALNAEAFIEPDDRPAYWFRAFQTGRGDGAIILISDVTAEDRREQAEREFVANAAHELQSPLTGITTSIELLLAGAHEDEEDRLRFLNHISQENARLSRLLQSLLLLAQAQSGVRGTEPATFELLPLLDDLVRTEFAEASVDVSCPPQLEVVAHRDLLERALSNLVSNAVRHGGGGRVAVEARADGEGIVVVDVTDAGPGMTRRERDQAFERFYRGTRTGDGFGLGLAIVREAARAAGGEVELLSGPGAGTTARLRLRGGP